MSTWASGLYAGTVAHRRFRPRPHQLKYDVFALVLDLDEVPALDRAVAGFTYNRPGLLAFYDRDHGPGRDAPLRPWVERQLAAAGIDLAGGPIRLMCYPRILGYVFNPISVYFCYGAGGLAAIIYQVSNTFGERHSYLIPVAPGSGPVIRQGCDKGFYVSPFVPMDMRYDFSVRPPAEELAVTIVETDRDGTLLTASFTAERRELSGPAVFKAFLSYPALTLKVIGGIHWEALKLWLKGIPLVHRPRPPATDVSIIAHAEDIAAIPPGP